MEKGSLVELCFGKMDEAQVKPEEVGLPEPVGIQYYRHVAEGLKEELEKEKKEYKRALEIVKSCIENGDQVKQLIDLCRDGTLLCKRCKNHCLIEVADDGYSFYQRVISDEYIKVDDEAYPKQLLAIRQIPYMVGSLCIGCVIDDTPNLPVKIKCHDEGCPNEYEEDPEATVFCKCQICKKQSSNKAYSLVTRTLLKRVTFDTDSSRTAFFVEGAGKWHDPDDPSQLYINCLCEECWLQNCYIS